MTRARLTPSRISAGTLLAVVGLALLFCAPVQAGSAGRRTVKRPPMAAATQAKPVTPAAVPTAATPTATTGMVAAIDPGTGHLVMPTPEAISLLTAAERIGLLRTSAGLTEVPGPDGRDRVDLQGRFMEFTVVRLDLQGRPHFLSVNEAQALLRLLDPRAPAPTPVCEER